MGRFTKVVMFVVVLIYIWCLYIYLNTPIRTDIVKMGLLEDSENVTAYLIKDEKLLYSNYGENFDEIAKEGERVSKGSKIAIIYKNDVDPKIQEALKKINERIADISSNQANNALFSGDLKKLDDQIRSKIDEVINASRNGEASMLSKLKSDINQLLDKKMIISGEKGASGKNLEALQKEKESYEQQLSSSKMDLIAEVSGVVSYQLDGLEQILNPEKINEFTPEDFESLERLNLSNAQADKELRPIAKIIDNYKWYIGFLMDADKVYPMKVGEKVKIRFRDLKDKVIDASVYFISEEQKGKVVVVLCSDKYIDSFSSMRKVNVDIIKSSYSGFKIPVSAIRVKDGKTGVYIISDQVVRFREVEIIYKNDNFAIVKENSTNKNGLLLYDEVITKGKDIEEGKLVR
ncbi:MAG: hypothetical protein GX066_08375 [Clostridiaceae bacterium]|nr:hypothetical protein [Clostridiaceae bacterium]